MTNTKYKDISITCQCMIFKVNICHLVLKMLEGLFLAVGTINLKKLMRILFLGQWIMRTKALLAWGRNKLAMRKVFSKALGETEWPSNSSDLPISSSSPGRFVLDTLSFCHMHFSYPSTNLWGTVNQSVQTEESRVGQGRHSLHE